MVSRYQETGKNGRLSGSNYKGAAVTVDGRKSRLIAGPAQASDAACDSAAVQPVLQNPSLWWLTAPFGITL
jgi:hypothetical protein